MDAFWMEPNFTINRLFLECTSVESTLYKHWVVYSVNYQSRLDTGWTLYVYCRKITFATVGRMLGLLYTQHCTNAGILQSTTGAE